MMTIRAGIGMSPSGFRHHVCDKSRLRDRPNQVQALLRFARSCPRQLFLLTVGLDGPKASCAKLGVSSTKPEPSMSEIKRVGIDTSKAVFTLHCVDQADHPVLRVNLR